ncbi:MAG: polyisoprenoid-binding protein [Rhodobacteraceae bacterium]|nr:polyisoprenoid-binding protein [Paracoccaceae bacterium]
MFKFTCILVSTVMLGLPVSATPQAYDFVYASSKIEFTYDFNGDAVIGGFPKFDGDLVIDFADMRRSSVRVSIDTASSQGGFIFATSALRGPKILNAGKFPKINFRSVGAKVVNGVARITGEITVRDVTRPITLTARFFQLEGQNPESRDELAMQITGKINRHEFGASGYPDMVGNTLNIRIVTKIKRRQ